MSCSRKGQDSLPLLPPLRLSALAWGGPQQASTGDRCLLKSMTFDIVCYFGNVNSWNTDTQSCQHPDIQNHNWVFCRSSYSQASPFAAQTLSGSRCCQEEPPTLLPQRGEPVSFWAFRQVTPKLPCFFSWLWLTMSMMLFLWPPAFSVAIQTRINCCHWESIYQVEAFLIFSGRLIG